MSSITTASADDAGARTASERLAAWGAGLTPEDLPDAMRAKVRDVLVDVVGLCLAARQTDYVKAAAAAIEPGGQTILGRSARAAATSAALVNGTAAHGEDFDDTFEGGPVHSGAVVVPAVLAAAEGDRLPAARIELGIAAGLELLCRLGLTAPKAVHKAGFHPTAVLGSFAAAFAVGVARGADRQVLQDALGIVGSMASGIIEYLGDGSWTKRMHPGWAAQSGLRAVWLASAGFVGPKAVFDGTHGFFKSFAPTIEPLYDQLFAGLGERWHAETISFKPYPCGTRVQPYIDCAIALHQAGAAHIGLKSITCETAEGIVHRLWEPLAQKQTPPNAYAAKFSTPFGVALGLVRGQAGLEDFSEAAVRDEALLAVSRLVTFEIDPGNPYPAAFTGHIRLDYEDGSQREMRQSHLRGGAEAPLSRDEIDAKFRANAEFGGVAAPERLLQAAEAVLSAEGGFARIAELGDTA
jgi:2-methylcitrate dehydratase PrpD